MRVVNRLAEQAAIKGRREGRTINQAIIAEDTGLAFNTVNAWWHNRVTRYDEVVIITLCRYIPCNVSDLLTIEDVEANKKRAFEASLSGPSFDIAPMLGG